ncbi:hypothetical protein ACFLSH_00760 [Bacteroidota bacterium]
MTEKIKINSFIKAGFIMIIILGGMVTYGISNITLNSTTNQGTQNTVDNFSINRVQNIAMSMTDILLTRLADDLEYRTESKVPVELFGGKVTYTVEDNFSENDNRIKIKVVAVYHSATKIVTTYIAKKADYRVPTVGGGAWSVNTNLNNTIRDMCIDGRDRDLNQNVNPA